MRAPLRDAILRPDLVAGRRARWYFGSRCPMQKKERFDHVT